MLRSRTLREGSVGLFALVGLILLGGLAIWLRGGGLGQQGYQFTVRFEDVSGLQIGAPVRYRGVNIGKIASLQPGSNHVDVVLEIASTDLQIPRDAIIRANRYGLIGEASVDITPQQTLPASALSINPNKAICQDKNIIICDGDQLSGDSGSQLVESLTRLSQAYSDPVFLANLNAAAQNAAQAAGKIAKLSDEVALLSKTARQEIQGVSETTAAIAQAADNASRLVERLDQVIVANQGSIANTLDNTSRLTGNLNSLVTENRNNLATTIADINQTSVQFRQLANSLDLAVNRLNAGLAEVDPPEVAKDLEQLMVNARETSANLREISETLNDPANLVAIQETLDSARATFANTQKITADIDELIGDPQIRENLRQLINGLSDLLSSSEQLNPNVATLTPTPPPSQPQLQPPRLKSFHHTVKNTSPPPQWINPQTASYQLSPLPPKNPNLSANKP